MAKGHRVLRYMSRFRCVGPACEASCCHGHTIAVDEGHYRQLERSMAGSEDDRGRFAGAMRPVRPEERTPHRHALIVLDDAGACRLLDPEGTCSAHRRFGEEVLPHSCAIYPRQVSLAHGTLELAGTLSCPEVARLLYGADDATAMDPLDPTRLRKIVTQVVPADSGDPYDRVLDDVRATVVELLTTAGYPLASRLFFVSQFAELTRGAFHRDAGPDAVGVLADAVEVASGEETLACWHQAFAVGEPSARLALRALAGALAGRVVDTLAHEPFARMVAACFASLGVDAGGDLLGMDAEATWAAYLERRRRRDSEAVDRMIMRYAIDYWLKDFYTGSHDLAVHARKLVFRIALLRFLFVSHPDFDAADPARTLVQVTFKLSRAVEHDHELTESFDTLLERLGITSLAHLVSLMKV